MRNELQEAHKRTSHRVEDNEQEASPDQECPTEEEIIEGRINRAASPDEALWLRALLFKDQQAAEELWNRSLRATLWLTALILESPDLIAQALRRSTEVPVMMSLTPTSEHYYGKLAAHLNEHHLGADSGIAAGKNARWGGKNRAATLAYRAFTAIYILRGAHSTDLGAQSLAKLVKKKFPGLVEKAHKLNEFGQNNTKKWCDLCINILDATIEPGLKPGKQGRRKKGAEPANLQNKKMKALRDQIRARLRDIVAAPDKRH